MKKDALKAPFQYFGGKSYVSDIVWDRFGDVPNYVEPFAGSLAVLLGRPSLPKKEFVNDYDGFISNFWRSIKFAPDKVAEYADWPKNENDLHARHAYLRSIREDFRQRVEGDPEFYDPKIAGWWVWGICSFIGHGFAGDGSKGPWIVKDGKLVHDPHCKSAGISRQRVAISGQGIHRKNIDLKQWFEALSQRFRNVTVLSGDWSRALTRTPTIANGLTGVFLDPPYAADRAELYAHDDFSIAHKVREWCIENGKNKLFRIALCGYEGEHEMPDNWEVVAWKAASGYAGARAHMGMNEHSVANRTKERIWFSPHCLKQNSMLF